jgi:lipopolysaccharide export system protein LptA
MRRAASLVAALALGAGGWPAADARAEKADRAKPTQIEANRMTSDEVRKITVFEGNVVLTKGTRQIRAERVVVRMDADGHQYATATGSPVRFRQKGDPAGGREGVWTDGEALRIEVNDREEKVELFERARVSRDQDEVKGEYIFLDQRSEFFSVSAPRGGAAPGTDTRVRAIIQPRLKPEAAAPAAPGPAAPPAPATPSK